jgi:4-amino-4-deoxy-L-arabinose transferase-like glycosyltransferase
MDVMLRWMLLIVGGVTLLRIAAIAISPLDLHFDEAQYWAWSRQLDWGYFSKPPLVAWAIATTTAVFGNGEWAVRLTAPLGHAAASVILFFLARRLYGSTAGLLAGVGWLCMPAVWLSSAVISTDALLLPIWAGALWAFFRLLDKPGWGPAIGLGVLIGVGALAKYAMLYFVGCAALAALIAPGARAALLSRYGLVSALAALAVLMPNLAWNASHDFATIEHTAANANLEGDLFNLGEMIDFLFSQLGVFGPVLFGALVFLLYRAARRFGALSETDRILIAFILPPLVAITFQALLSRAHANWAASAYPAGVVWLAGQLVVSQAGRRVLIGGHGLNALIGAVFLSFTAFPPLADALGVGGPFKRARGWDAVCQETAARTAVPGAAYSAVLVDHRALFFALSYYCRPEVLERPLPPIRMWLLRAEAANHAAATAPMNTAYDANVLVVHMSEGYVPVVWEDFRQADWLGRTIIDLGGGQTRWIGYSHVSGFAPVTRDDAFEDRLRTRPTPPVLPGEADPNLGKASP